MSPWSLRARKVIGSAAGVVDRAFVAAIHARSARDRARAEQMPHADRLAALLAVHEAYGSDELLRDHAAFFPAPPPVTLSLRAIRSGVWDAAWPSAYEPYFAEVRERYLARVENRTARARVFLAEGPDRSTKRPAVIAIHGYMGGHYMLEEAQWPIPWMVRRGLDVALPVLPFHAIRGSVARGSPPFPSSDPRLTNEGFRQAVADIVCLARWLRARGSPHVGVVGMSLGGFTSALLATVSDEIDFSIPMIPLASIADFAREQGRLGIGDEASAQHAALERANWVVSPLARPLRLPKTRTLVVAAEHDRITPSSHAARIAAHFDCEMMTVAGGHLVQLGRGDAFRALAAMLEREGVIAPRAARAARR